MMPVSPSEAALILAVLLAVVEVLTGTFVFLSFGLGCLAVAVVEACSARSPFGLDVLAFALVSGFAVVGLRRAFGRAGDSRRSKTDVNEY